MQKNSLLVAIIALFSIVALAPTYSYAQGSSEPAVSADPNTPTTALATDKTWGDKERPENYVPSKAPTKSESPYNFTQMGLAGLVMLCMAGFTVWLIRRNTREEVE